MDEAETHCDMTDCGCRIVFCSLHAAAPELLETLRRITTISVIYSEWSTVRIDLGLELAKRVAQDAVIKSASHT